MKKNYVQALRKENDLLTKQLAVFFFVRLYIAQNAYCSRDVYFQ